MRFSLLIALGLVLAATEGGTSPTLFAQPDEPVITFLKPRLATIRKTSGATLQGYLVTVSPTEAVLKVRQRDNTSKSVTVPMKDVRSLRTADEEFQYAAGRDRFDVLLEAARDAVEVTTEATVSFSANAAVSPVRGSSAILNGPPAFVRLTPAAPAGDRSSDAPAGFSGAGGFGGSLTSQADWTDPPPGRLDPKPLLIAAANSTTVNITPTAPVVSPSHGGGFADPAPTAPPTEVIVEAPAAPELANGGFGMTDAEKAAAAAAAAAAPAATAQAAVPPPNVVPQSSGFSFDTIPTWGKIGMFLVLLAVVYVLVLRR